ncbi:MAG TPA: quinol:cytochrome C oxidoreductase [Bacteroidia bacterium]|nr:quinol:cytochrome C oxidoreductase [Bacteroidia bacterium]
MFTFTNKLRNITFALMAVGVIAVVYGFMTNPDRAWAALLHNNFYFNAIALCGLFFVAVQYVAQAGWSAGLIRVPQAMMSFLKFGCAGLLLIFILGHHNLYHWTHHELYDTTSPEYDPIVAGKAGFLNIPFYIIRLVLYGLIWAGFAWMIRKNSLQEDIDGGLAMYKRNFRLSAIFVVLFGITSSTSAWDILMSIDVHWFSTLFGWYTFAGLFVSGLAMMCMLVIYLRTLGYLENVNENHVHDIGKFMFAFTIFWTYLWFSQFMLIWYANLPEEVVYFQFRWEHFKLLWIGNLFINFLAPFLVLMSRDAKRQRQILITACIIIICGHWIDVFLMVFPGTIGSAAHIGLVEVGTGLGFLGAFLFVTFKELTKAALVPKNHPMQTEAAHHHI